MKTYNQIKEERDNNPIDLITGETLNSKRKTAIGLRLNSDLLEKVDRYALNMGVNRTAAISVILSMYFESKESIEVLNNITNLVRKEEKLENV